MSKIQCKEGYIEEYYVQNHMYFKLNGTGDTLSGKYTNFFFMNKEYNKYTARSFGMIR